MTWEDVVFSVFAVGSEMTVPQIVEALPDEQRHYCRNVMRSKIYRVMQKNEKYQFVKGIGYDERGARIWRRIR